LLDRLCRHGELLFGTQHRPKLLVSARRTDSLRRGTHGIVHQRETIPEGLNVLGSCLDLGLPERIQATDLCLRSDQIRLQTIWHSGSLRLLLRQRSSRTLCALKLAVQLASLGESFPRSSHRAKGTE